MSVITQEHRDFFNENGYVLIKNLVSQESCDRVISAMWDFMGKDRENRDEWYTPPKGMDEYMKAQHGGMLEMYHHQSMWDNRQNPRIYQAFAGILNNEKLWDSIDRVAMKPPIREGYDALDLSFIHWDMDTSNLPSPLVRPMGVQGVLYLADTSSIQGGFPSHMERT